MKKSLGDCYKKGGKVPSFAGGNPKVMAEAKKKTIGKIDGEPVSPRLDRPRRASGGKVMSPGAASSPMACAAKNGTAKAV